MRVVRPILAVIGCIIIALGLYSAVRFFLIQTGPEDPPGTVQAPEDANPDESPDGSEDDAQQNPMQTGKVDEARAILLSQAQTLADSMTLEQKIYQMIFTTPEAITGVETVTRAGDATKAALEKYPIGGIVYTGRNLEDADYAKELLDNTVSYISEAGNTMPFLGIFDNGGDASPVAIGLDEKDLPDPSTFAGSSEASQLTDASILGENISSSLQSYGFNVNFASGASWNDELFRDDVGVNAELMEAYLNGMQSNDLLAVLRDFPGTSVNDVIDKSKDVLLQEDLVAYSAAISAGSELVLVSPATVTELDGFPACLSSVVMDELLRQEMGFQGIILADVFNGTIPDTHDSSEAIVMAIEAGADMIYGGHNPEDTYSAILAAVNRGALSEDRINESVCRILAVKILYGLV